MSDFSPSGRRLDADVVSAGTDDVWGGGLRWSYTNRAWLGLFKSLPDGRIWLRHEMTFKHKTPEIAAVEMLARMSKLGASDALIYANPQLFPKAGERGESISETFRRAGIPVLRGSDDRINMFSRVRSWLAVREWKRYRQDGPTETFMSPGLLVHPSCTVLLKTLPTLSASTKDADDIEETPDEFPTAGVSYYLMSRPLPFTHEEQELPPDAIGHLVNEMRAAAARRD